MGAVRICTVIADQGRADLALGYRSWDDYVDARLGDLRITVPRERRPAVVHTLSHAHMSLRAIAKLLGVGVATVHRELTAGGAPTTRWIHPNQHWFMVVTVSSTPSAVGSPSLPAHLRRSPRPTGGMSMGPASSRNRRPPEGIGG